MTENPRTGEQPVERGAAEEGAGVPVTQTEVEADRRPPSLRDSDQVTQDDGSGTAGGASGGTGGTSGLPGAPDAGDR
jgi:hypothetical protein